ncbi:MAG TPA: carbamoyl phosphate synthase small subunit [Clostridiales bacterium UBA8153]|nr:carbamoyl phosphate synthase small subunit [Clostridiales bacterium UBA8153]
MQGRLVLEDGTVYHGKAFGRPGTATGEVVFNTGITGYQEVMTDPAYCGQILTMTYPLMGNTGICQGDSQAARPYLRGLVVHQLCASPSHTRMVGRLDHYLYGHGILALEGVDTRALTHRLRQHGAMAGVMTSEDTPVEELLQKLAGQPAPDLVGEVATRRPWRVFGDGPHLVVVDLGVKRDLIQYGIRHNFTITVVPPSTAAEDVLDMRPDGVLFSSGPGDPAWAGAAVATARGLIGKTPLFGICLGHQVLALALGGRTVRLKSGHRGGSHPVLNLGTRQVEMTAQNHGFVVDREALAGLNLEVTHTHLRDGSVEGLAHCRLPVQTLQYHPDLGGAVADPVVVGFFTRLGGKFPVQNAPSLGAALVCQGV